MMCLSSDLPIPIFFLLSLLGDVSRTCENLLLLPPHRRSWPSAGAHGTLGPVLLVDLMKVLSSVLYLNSLEAGSELVFLCPCT